MVEIIGTTSDIRVRVAELADADTLTDFAYKIAFETEGKTLDKVLVKRAIERLISTPRFGCYFLAWDENDSEKKSIGTTMLTYEMSVSVGGLIHFI